MVSRIGRGKKKKMKDKIKAELIDQMLLGKDVQAGIIKYVDPVISPITRDATYKNHEWALYTIPYKEIFRWIETPSTMRTMLPTIITLREALELVDRNWNKRA